MGDDFIHIVVDVLFVPPSTAATVATTTTTATTATTAAPAGVNPGNNSLEAAASGQVSNETLKQGEAATTTTTTAGAGATTTITSAVVSDTSSSQSRNGSSEEQSPAQQLQQLVPYIALNRSVFSLDQVSDQDLGLLKLHFHLLLQISKSTQLLAALVIVILVLNSIVVFILLVMCKVFFLKDSPGRNFGKKYEPIPGIVVDC